MNSRRIRSVIIFATVALAPLGTRLIWRTGTIDGVSIEPGTISLFATQLLALLYVVAVLLSAGHRPFAAVLGRRKTLLSAAVFAMIVLLSATQAGDKGSALLAASWVVLGVVVCVAMAVDRPAPAVFFAALMTGAALQSVLGSWQFFVQSAPASKWLGMAAHQAAVPGVFVVETEAGRWLRAYGTCGHPNVYAFYVALGILACVGLLAAAGKRGREPFLALLPLLTAGFFFAFSKSAIVALAVGLAFYLLATARPHLTRVDPAVIITLLVIAAAFLTMGWVYREPALTRATGQGRLEAVSWNERQALAGDALKLFAGHAILGVGVGQMPFAVRRELADGRNAWQYQDVHDLPLIILVETGLVGLLAWLVFVIAALRVVLRGAADKARPAAPVLAAMVLAVLAAGLFDHFLWSSWPGQLFFWLVLGSALSELDKGGSAT
jgi:hypothetical protein